jgi:hypothetical protein
MTDWSVIVNIVKMAGFHIAVTAGILSTPSLRANGSRTCAPDDRLHEASHRATERRWIALSQTLLAMTA